MKFERVSLYNNAILFELILLQNFLKKQNLCHQEGILRDCIIEKNQNK